MRAEGPLFQGLDGINKAVLGIAAMQIRWGKDAAESRKSGQEVFCAWDSRTTINGHILVLGDSGVGKTYTLRRMISDMLATSSAAVRFHVFDVHGDIDIRGASSVGFSESTDYGFNPLELNPDKDFGGVRKRTQSFISTINRTSRKLGPKQEAVLRSLLTDLYALHGFKADSSETWFVRHEDNPAVGTKAGRIYLEVPFEEKDRAKAAGAMWDSEARSWFVSDHAGAALRWGPKQFGKKYPTMLDAVRFSTTKLKAMFIGGNHVAIRLLEDVNKAARALRSKQIAAMRATGVENAPAEKEQGDLEKAQAKAIDAYKEAVNAIATGRELDDLIKYDSVDVLKSVVDRLDNLNAIGIFRNTPPPFDPATPVWRYDIKALNEDEKRMFVTFRLEAIFARAIQRGLQSDVVEVIVLDEAHLFTSDDADHILNKLVKEARKFGVAIVLASQSPSHFSDDLISGVGTKVILGLDKFYWDVSRRKLGLDEESLKFVVPKKRIVVQMKKSGALQNKCSWVTL